MNWQIIAQDVAMAIQLILELMKQLNPPKASSAEVEPNLVHTVHVSKNADGTVVVRYVGQ